MKEFLHPSINAALATCLIFLAENGLLREETLSLAVAAGALGRDEVTAKLRHLIG